MYMCCLYLINQFVVKCLSFAVLGSFKWQSGLIWIKGSDELNCKCWHFFFFSISFFADREDQSILCTWVTIRSSQQLQVTSISRADGSDVTSPVLHRNGIFLESYMYSYAWKHESCIIAVLNISSCSCSAWRASQCESDPQANISSQPISIHP